MQFYFGADYYPEHWPRERWDTDAQLMEEMGLQVVRMGEFSWAKFEPEEGVYCFEWLDDAIALLGAHGIKTVVGTPSAAPPAWMIQKYPEILPVDSHGERKGFGGRHHDCQSSRIYRSYIRKLVTAMAEHYKKNPHVAGWQIDNELGNSHMDLCMCESCRAAFQDWLRKKYGTIERLNQEWGTAFWSQNYNSFEQIPAPRVTPTAHNPSLLLDWKRFCSDLIVDFQQMQVDIIRKICPGHFITHNMMGLYDKTDYFDLAESLDFVSHDQYPLGYYQKNFGQPPEELASNLDIMRGTKNKPFWIMEMQAGPTGGDMVGVTPRPGQLRLWTAQSIAHGADTIVYFRWRTCTFGYEEYWHGILPHNGVPGRRFEELKKTAKEFTPVLEDIQGIVPQNEAAIFFSYDQDWAFQIQPHHVDLKYEEVVQRYYNAFFRAKIPADFIGKLEDMDRYRVVVAPLQFLMDGRTEDVFIRYVENGGRLVLTFRTGVKNENNICMSDAPLPGRLGKLLGLEIPDYDCMMGFDAGIAWMDGSVEGRCNLWSDILTLKGAEPLAQYTSEFYAGTPAVTRHAYGKGAAYYVATSPDDAVLNRLIDCLKAELQLYSCGEAIDQVEMAVRPGRENAYLFLLNHTAQKQTALPVADWSDTPVVVEPYGVKILKRPHERK